MNPIIRALQRSRQYFIAFTVCLFLLFVYCTLFSKTTCFLQLNGKHFPALDRFFTFYTVLGDGLMALLLFVGLLIGRRYLQGIHVLMAFLSSGLVAQCIKQVAHMPRPRTFLQPEQYSQFIDGVTRSGWASFPSGHTATAFAVATILSFYTRKKGLSLFYLSLAMGVGYSRIYLGQHFLEDVLAGAILGVFFAAWIYVSLPSLKLFGRTIGGQEPVVPPVALQ